MNPSKKAGVLRKGQQILHHMKSCCTLVCGNKYKWHK